MKLTLQPTDRIDRVQGTPCRVWAGETEDGTAVHAWIATVQPQTHDPERLAAFERDLREIQLRRELVSIDLRMVT